MISLHTKPLIDPSIVIKIQIILHIPYSGGGHLGVGENYNIFKQYSFLKHVEAFYKKIHNRRQR